jgi:hypothetical protein
MRRHIRFSVTPPQQRNILLRIMYIMLNYETLYVVDQLIAAFTNL